MPNDSVLTDDVLRAAQDRSRVSGLTHNFYRYPARFSPLFVRAVIDQFTSPGDLVADPFMGGGTTAVESLASGRRFVGTDISRLAHFVAIVKTTPIPTRDLDEIVDWFDGFSSRATSREQAIRPMRWIEAGYQRHLDGDLQPIRKAIEIALSEAENFPRPRQRRFARAVILKTAQHAMDTRKNFPSVSDFRSALGKNAHAMAASLTDFARVSRNAIEPTSHGGRRKVLRRVSAARLADVTNAAFGARAPRLVLTSPPYPGVHVLYHRWQVRGGRETPAPFWIADVKDGDATSYYTIADRHNEDAYFDRLTQTFRSIRAACDAQTVMVQMLAFRDAGVLLPRYLQSMSDAGFQHVEPQNALPISRDVPNRRWYASDANRRSDSGTEYVLLHRPQ